MTGPMMTTGPAARHLGVSKPKLLQWAKTGIIPSFVDPETGYRYFMRPTLDRWLETNGTYAVGADEARS